MGDRVALLIATYDYQDSGLRRLTAPPHDAEVFAAVLRDPRIAGFDVTTLVNEPHHRVGEAIGEFYPTLIDVKVSWVRPASRPSTARSIAPSTAGGETSTSLRVTRGGATNPVPTEGGRRWRR